MITPPFDLVLSEEAIAGAVELDRELQELTDTLKVQATAVILEYKDEILATAQFITEDLIPALGSVAQAVIDFAAGLQPGIDALREFVGLARAALGIESGPGARTDGSVREEDVAGANALGGGDTSSTGQFYGHL